MQDEQTVAQILVAEGIADYPQDLRQLFAAAQPCALVPRRSDPAPQHLSACLTFCPESVILARNGTDHDRS